MEKIKVLVVGDAVAPTGFARVTHSIINNLPEDKYIIHHLGINYNGDPHDFGYKIYPAALGGDVFGVERIERLVRVLKPHVVFLVNDPWLIDMYLEKLRPVKETQAFKIVVYFPVDAEEHSINFYRNFDIVDTVCVYTDFGKRVVLDSGSENINEEKIKIIPHGISTNSFFNVKKEFAIREVFEKDYENYLDKFIILNANRNQPRKRMDITMWAFREFQKDKPDVKLYLHMGVVDIGYNIAELSVRYGFDTKLVLTTSSPKHPSISDERLNLIYNCCDIGINTSTGEGWGLTNWEHAATGKPQILPNHSALTEIWENRAILVPATIPHMNEGINTVGRVIDLDKLVESMNWAYNDWKNNGSAELKELGNKCFSLTQLPKFKWSSVSKQFDEIFRELL